MLSAITRVVPSHMLAELSETIMGSRLLGRLSAQLVVIAILELQPVWAQTKPVSGRVVDSSGAAIVGNPGSSGYGTLQQGFLETSNVNAVDDRRRRKKARVM